MSIKISLNSGKIKFLIFLSVFISALYFVIDTDAREKKTGEIHGAVVAKKAKYRKHAIAYIEKTSETYDPPVEHAVMDQKNITFIPHVLPILKGTTVDFLNSDDVRHNIYSSDDVADNMNLGSWFKGETRSFTFNKTGVATMRCNVHSDMLAYILILQNPYFSKVNDEGFFTINNVPEGKYTLKLWTAPKRVLWGKYPEAKDISIEVTAGGITKVAFAIE
ncbi:plastocyanin/azurin family copper-binding protein [Candidatus Kuenenia sp.]|uniref:plastocyanin/azurin family copper-binding protein n=1 Tax=Candidatus Kuenenia sp. TaxID=2499824 RepID=UPI00321F748E